MWKARMSGLDVLKHLGHRKIRIPTVIITAHDQAGSRSTCLNAGAVACLSKPCDPEQLIRTLEKILMPSLPDAALSTA